MDLVKAAEAVQMKEGRENVRIGDTVKVHFRIVEGKTERIQVYEGVVIAQNNSGIGKNITVRKISYGVGVEKIFPVHSPRIDKIEVLRHGKIRRSKLYYLRDRVGKAAKVREKIRRRVDRVADQK